ncbi:hypothetical protein B0I27_105321 [Arcticibacter pallidicorallinus]|uniref:Uncharacterized protein n=1 Tax=Arcticibacter pallidicorallinus TaxID=1259464 RepID=A0A2T0U4K4_9SPHI|nr:hypothetical protein [Arcticibacter pallidicorallinus]PRY52851.1 hypothetical protein B0I27_105321 [Arcticibacter pallidicorallinus]
MLTNELTVKRNGFWRPTYELTDGQYSYGLLRYEGSWRPKVKIETADTDWIVNAKGGKGSEIKTIEGESIAVTSRSFRSTKITFTAYDGFVATFVKPSIWRSKTIWEAEDGTELLHIKSRPFKMPVITFNVQAKQNRWLLLLAFLALEIHLKQQAAVAAT